MQPTKLLLSLLAFLISNSTFSQDSTSYADIAKIPSQYFEAVSKKATRLQENIEKKSQKVLARMQKAEGKLQQKLAKIDSLAANNIFKGAGDKYKELQSKVNKAQWLTKYIPQLDTLSTSFKFLEQNQQLLTNVKEAKEKLADATAKLNELKSKLQGTEDIKFFLKERKAYLKQQLEQFGFAKDLKKINKNVYYFSQQVNEYKEIFKDSKKAEKKAIELLSKTKLFKDFMKKNSMLASLFNMPGDPNDPLSQVNLAGLQTRTQVNSLIQNQITGAGPNAQQQFSQNLQGAQSQLQQLKNKITQAGGGSSDDIMPEGFRANPEKVKSFMQRLEYSINIQSQKATNFYPVINDVSLFIGYRLSETKIISIGASYKIGLGTGWDNIRFSQEGLSLRSSAELKFQRSFWFYVGYEMNYRTAFNSIAQLKDLNAWSPSCLLGLSKVISVRSKFFKKTKLQLLWNFLSEQVPGGQAIQFRVGYNLK